MLRIVLPLLFSATAVAGEAKFNHPEQQAIFDRQEKINQTWAIDRNCKGLREYLHRDTH